MGVIIGLARNNPRNVYLAATVIRRSNARDLLRCARLVRMRLVTPSDVV